MPKKKPSAWRRLLNTAHGRFYRSGGQPVTRSVKNLVLAGDAAREARDWRRAGHLYDAAIQRDPSLSHIWIQLGHALKELGQYDEAHTAYLKARSLSFESVDLSIQMGHTTKMAGKMFLAGQHYLDAFRQNPTDPEAFRELHHLLARGPHKLQQEIARALRRVHAADEHGSFGILRRDTPPPTGLRIVFDVSDLISYFSHARLPTGIQRVQIETIRAAMLMEERSKLHICCFLDGRDDWLEIAPEPFLALIEASLLSNDQSDPRWLNSLNNLYLDLRASPAFTFPHGAFLVNLGTSWWIENYFLYVRAAKAASQIRYVPFIYDLIPILTPQHCLPDLTRNFSSWLDGVFFHADFFFAISKATRDDFLTIAAAAGHDLPSSSIEVVPLDVEFSASSAVLEVSDLRRIGIDDQTFVLLVSTVESRKGHLLAFDAWARLIERFGEAQIPLLVCVGRNGWLNDAIYRTLREDPRLASRVRMVTGISDSELAALYERCMFTVYPSEYEGWGLPITEALCRGKAVITTTSSSLPEAGGRFAIYVEPGDGEAFAGAVESLIFEADTRKQREELIEREFRPRRWTELADQLSIQIAIWEQLQLPPTALAPPRIDLEIWYAIVRRDASNAPDAPAWGEALRSGTGWWWPEPDGCWTRDGGGGLALCLPDEIGPLKLELVLKGLPSRRTRWTIRQDDCSAETGGVLEAGEKKCAVLDIASRPESGILRLTLASETVEEAEIEIGSGTGLRQIGIGLERLRCCRPIARDTRSSQG